MRYHNRQRRSSDIIACEKVSAGINFFHVKGFTLIELMIVISIIGILASIAVPNYQDRIIQAQITEALEISKTLKSAINDFYVQNHKFPKNNQEANLPLPEHLIGNFTTQVTLVDGALHVRLGNKINAHVDDQVITIRPAYVEANPSSPICWLCGNSPPVKGMVGQGENQTTVPENYLPIACRSWR